ncbi:WD40 repeat-like protein [Favolaschia claudopus]|uniref:WD40 repeat-like protein n=1 Tax=Favolaschia claudopus TaxID=2862362 RepID=A0AAW0C5P1_9AGAR
MLRRSSHFILSHLHLGRFVGFNAGIYGPSSSFSAVEEAIRRSSFYPDDENRSFDDLLQAFRINCEGLERQLELFASSVRQLGSSLGLYKGSREFQRQLSNIRRLLEDESQIERLLTPKAHNSLSETWVHQDLWLLVDSLTVFSTAWDDFPEFIDNDRRHYLVALEQDLLVWLNIVGSYEYSPEFLRCVRELLYDTILELDNMTKRLADFIATGVQEISFAQKHSTQILWNSATIATFFSAVTVTTIQYSYMQTNHWLEVTVNSLWFSSLVLSVSSAINSVLSMTWRQAIYSTPQRRVPWWVRVWFKETPIILLSFSVLLFVAGLLCFVIHTQRRPTILVVLALTGIVAVGLGAISVWFAWERWDFSRLRAKLWKHRELDSIESSWRLLAYDYVVGIIWRSTSTALPMHSRKHRLLQNAGSFILRRHSFTADSNIPENLHKNEDRGYDSSVNVPILAVPYSESIFADLTPRRTLRLGRNQDAVRHVQFSSRGTWFAACTISICYIYQVKPEIRTHQVLRHPFGQIREVQWSPDEKMLLIRVSGGIELWEVKGCNNLEIRRKEWMGKIIRKVQWIDNTTFLVSMEDALVQFKIRDDGHLTQHRPLRFNTELYTFAVVPSRNCVLVVTGHTSRIEDDIRLPKRTIRCVQRQVLGVLDCNLRRHEAVYNLSTGTPLYSFPLLRDARWINVSSDGRHVVFGFSSQQAPELWYFTEETSGHRLCFKHRFASNIAKERFRGAAHFVGPRDEFVACAGLADSVQIWSRDENRTIGSVSPLNFSGHRGLRKAIAMPVLAWHPGQAMFAAASSEMISLWAPETA